MKTAHPRLDRRRDKLAAIVRGELIKRGFKDGSKFYRWPELVAACVDAVIVACKKQESDND